METWLMQSQSLCILLLIVIGVVLILRKKRSAHIKVVSLAMIWDILLILQIELSRSAILKASKALTNEMMLNIHVSIAVSTVVLYGFMVYTGRKILNGQTHLRRQHKILGYSTLILRTLTFITSFWAVVPKE